MKRSALRAAGGAFQHRGPKERTARRTDGGVGRALRKMRSAPAISPALADDAGPRHQSGRMPPISAPAADPGCRRRLRPEPMTPPPPMLDLQGVRKSFGAIEALKGIDLAVAHQELVFIIGPSGSGKSTLPSLLQPARGADRGASPRRRRRHRLAKCRHQRDAPAHRHGVPVVQPVPAPLRPR